MKGQITMTQSMIENAAKRMEKTFGNCMLGDAVEKYITHKVTKDDLLFYLYWSEFDVSDIDWNEIEKQRLSYEN